MTQTTPDPNLFPTDPTEATDRPANGSRNGVPQKRGSLTGGALTEEALASSRRVLHKSRGNKNATS